MRICSIGECMIEFSNTEKDIFKLGYAGDTANSAIYLSRLGANSSYITTLGEDYLSKKMINFLKKENVKTIFEHSVLKDDPVDELIADESIWDRLKKIRSR